MFINSHKINKSSFIIKITSDYQSSSGTERKSEANLTFVDNKLVTGMQSYVVIPSPLCSGGPGECGSRSDCIVENGQWVDATNKGKCNMPPDISNISLTNSDWTKKKIKEIMDVDAQVVYPPVFDDFAGVEWSKKKMGLFLKYFFL